MASAEPTSGVLGPWCGGTSAVAGVLHHLGVFMGTQFDWNYRELHETWEDSSLSQLCRRAFSEPALSCRWILSLWWRIFAVGPTVIAVPPARRGAGPA